MIWKILTILVLIAAIVGGTGYFVNQYYFVPKQLDLEERTAIAIPMPTPPPDPSIAVFETLKPMLESDSPESAEAVAGFLKAYPESPMVAPARAALSRINGVVFFSPTPSADRVAYSVVSGDSLVKIAAKFKTGAELISRVNGLTTINLKIGQALAIPQIETAVVIDRAAGTVTVTKGGEFFREYTAQALKLPNAASSGVANVTVSDKFVLKGANRIAFGTKDFETGDRWISLGTSGGAIRSAPLPGADGVTPPTPPGVILSPSDAAEVFVLVKTGTPVTIR